MDDATPKFNLSCVSRKWAKDWLRVNAQIQRSTMLLNRETSDDATPDQRQALDVARMEAFDSMDGLIEQQETLVAEVLSDVPREWLMPDAPKNLDWSKRESLDWMQDSRFNDLLAALGAERAKSQEARQNSKN